MTTAAPSRRPMIGVLAVLAGAAALGLVATGRTWATVADPASLQHGTVPVSGGDLVPLASPVFLVAGAAALVIPVMGRLGRRIVAVVLAILALILVAMCVPVILDLDAAALRWVGRGDLEVTSSVAWPVGTAVLGFVIAVVAVLVVVRAPSWPGLSSRYERGSTGGSARRRSAAAESTRSRDTWDALDRGDDPTS